MLQINGSFNLKDTILRDHKSCCVNSECFDSCFVSACFTTVHFDVFM